jgi:hypothetical protein
MQKTLQDDKDDDGGSRMPWFCCVFWEPIAKRTDVIVDSTRSRISQQRRLSRVDCDDVIIPPTPSLFLFFLLTS